MDTLTTEKHTSFVLPAIPSSDTKRAIRYGIMILILILAVAGGMVYQFKKNTAKKSQSTPFPKTDQKFISPLPTQVDTTKLIEHETADYRLFRPKDYGIEYEDVTNDSHSFAETSYVSRISTTSRSGLKFSNKILVTFFKPGTPFDGVQDSSVDFCNQSGLLADATGADAAISTELLIATPIQETDYLGCRLVHRFKPKNGDPTYISESVSLYHRKLTQQGFRTSVGKIYYLEDTTDVELNALRGALSISTAKYPQ